ncbi:carbohydrate kinase, YjeF related protein [Magnetococcus marinus MC-1]|uniref:Bifunctional NAD(P)H-hydrate repair enzyme n=1 Tax=Magnetococcus marinus (strain ATCC BAA-1437 / JCM 17883 / MC-1) TaxID=156889 RepID=A0LCV3_MAGMM|nr:bifunctional ADP-dependent NAD(P)H-hydrate dehydratase/NAD(P)H-hydrate epimerase [Magnetococcus marinus]ABK45796.1 carbohydrate kinase, YjeF related protein [Magnetococcus marinus MC-1]
MQPLLTAEQMRRVDQDTIERFGLPGMVLMENAGRACVDLLYARLPDLARRRVLILCGGGNNGGDGLVIARWLRDAGVDTRVVLFTPADRLTGDAATNQRLYTRLGGELREALHEEDLAKLPSWLGHAGVVVDALLGTGLERAVEGHFALAIEQLNASRKPVLAVDLPSGIHADTGQILGCAVRATWCVTFAAAKIAHYTHPGAEHCGEITVAPIGIPRPMLERPEHTVSLNSPARWHPPARSPASHKGNHGHLLILGGSRGKGGAPALAAMAAQRMGSGLITCAVPRSVQPQVASLCPEAMTFAMDEESDGGILPEHRGPCKQLGFNPSVVAVGPGLGTGGGAAELIAQLMITPLPMVMDADALNLLALQPGLLRAHRAPELVLTPHPGEFSRLCGHRVEEIQADRVTIARNFARSWRVWLVLKGAGTVIASPDNRVWINPTGNHGLATGGSGDLLTGCIAGLMAQGWSLQDATLAGVWMHGRAAELSAAEQGGAAGMQSRDLLPYLRRLRNQLPQTTP